MTDFLIILQTVTPVFLIAFLGIGLRRLRLIDDHFVESGSRLVFNVALPALIFISLSDFDKFPAPDARLILLVYTGTTLITLAVWIISARFIHNGSDLGAFVHGCFRSNYAIVGFAVIFNVFGEEALASAAVILAFLMPLYNFLGILILTLTTHQENRLQPLQLIRAVLTNPLIIAVLIALPFALLRISIPPVLAETAGILAKMALPLALIGIGGQMHLEGLKKISGMALTASAVKLIVIPLLMTVTAIQMGYRDETLGVLYLLFASPSSVASFVMARAMRVNSRLAGNIVLITTLAAGLTITMGLFLLRRLNYL